MPEYNFLNLSPPEFEELSRDLLQKSLSIYLESFTNGKDGGIDFRHSASETADIIVQAKRYQQFDTLLKVLEKDELCKVKKLAPKRYILTTSVGLTPKQKTDIKKLMSPYILNSSDIYGRDDLNNLLGLYPEVEKDHFKLWLSSINILEKVLHSKVLNQSNFEEEKIRETVKVYVENDSYFDALEIIRNKKYVIISGTPGIGKTTLARILVYHYLANGFDEFVYLSDSIDDAYTSYKEQVKQVFLFDDFLGRNFLDKQLSNNEEQRIVRFIEKINKSNHKVLLLTTREYILAQAKLRYDIFDNPSLEFAKCVIDLSKYTKLVKAKILYNHLFFSKIDASYIQNLLADKAYEKIIDHKNYSPRIIETATNRDVWGTIPPNDFASMLLQFLTYPESIWKHVYESQITRLSQCMLLNLLTLGTPVTLEDLKLQTQSFAKRHQDKYGLRFSNIDFKKSLKELENTFISISKDSINHFAVDYANPSVQDFLVNYFKGESDQLEDVLQTAMYFGQIFHVFTERFVELPPWAGSNDKTIILTNRQRQIVIERLTNDLETLQQSLVVKLTFTGSSNFQWFKRELSIYAKLMKVVKFFPLADYPNLEAFVVAQFKNVIIPQALNDDDFRHYVDLFEKYESECSYDPNEVIHAFTSKMYFLHHVKDFERLEIYMPSEFDEFTTTDESFKVMVSNLMYEEARDAEDYNLEDTLNEISDVGDKFDIDYKSFKDDIQERLDVYESRLSADHNWDNDNQIRVDRASNEEKVIDDLFGSLLSRIDEEQNLAN